jgi:hypothetical protein
MDIAIPKTQADNSLRTIIDPSRNSPSPANRFLFNALDTLLCIERTTNQRWKFGRAATSPQPDLENGCQVFRAADVVADIRTIRTA